MISIEGSALPARIPTWISRPVMYCSRMTLPPYFRQSVSAERSCCASCAMDTPIDEPLAIGLTTQGVAISPRSVSISSAV